MLIKINGKFRTFRSALLEVASVPVEASQLARIVAGEGDWRRGGVVWRSGSSWSVRHVSGPVVYGAARRERRRLRARVRRVGLQRCHGRGIAAALRARRDGVLSERRRLEFLARGGPFCWCGASARWLGRCGEHGGSAADQRADV